LQQLLDKNEVRVIDSAGNVPSDGDQFFDSEFITLSILATEDRFLPRAAASARRLSQLKMPPAAGRFVPRARARRAPGNRAKALQG